MPGWTPGTNMYFVFCLMILLIILIWNILSNLSGRSSKGMSEKPKALLDAERSQNVSERNFSLVSEILPWQLFRLLVRNILSRTKASNRTTDNLSDVKRTDDLYKVKLPNSLDACFRQKPSIRENEMLKRQMDEPSKHEIAASQISKTNSAFLDQEIKYKDYHGPHFQHLMVCPAKPVYAVANPAMRYEQSRFASFHNVSEAHLPPGTRPIHLAAAGFYFDQENGMIRCFSCGAVYLIHFPNCTRLVENVAFPQSPSPPSTPPPEGCQVMNVVARPPRPPPFPVPCGAGLNPHRPGYSAASMCSSSGAETQTTQPMHNLPPNRRHVTSDQSDGALAAAPESSMVSSSAAPGKQSTKPPATPVQGATENTPPVPCHSCRHKSADTTFLPCGHRFLCQLCAAELRVCSLCQGTIDRKTL